MLDLLEYGNKFEPKRGCLLISEPFLPDPNFIRSVVYLCEHNEEGSFGFILNKPSLLKLEDVIEEVSDFDKTLFDGGPVEQNTMHFLHKEGLVVDGAIDLGGGIYWGGDFKQLMSMINTKVLEPGNFRFFLGYSGWGAGQLERELESKSWIVTDIVGQKEVFHPAPEQQWKNVLSSMGGKFKAISNFPIDPTLN